MRITDEWTRYRDRTIEATWLTDVEDKGGVRQVTLTARHTAGVYRLTGAIVTRKEENGVVYTMGTVFEDPVVSLLPPERARYSVKRLETMFDAAMAGFDVEKFYATYERAGVTG